jgi:hypothetical protein
MLAQAVRRVAVAQEAGHHAAVLRRPPEVLPSAYRFKVGFGLGLGMRFWLG